LGRVGVKKIFKFIRFFILTVFGEYAILCSWMNEGFIKTNKEG